MTTPFRPTDPCPVCRYKSYAGHSTRFRSATTPSRLARLFGKKPEPARLVVTCLGCDYSESQPVEVP